MREQEYGASDGDERQDMRSVRAGLSLLGYSSERASERAGRGGGELRAGGSGLGSTADGLQCPCPPCRAVVGAPMTHPIQRTAIFALTQPG